MTTSGCFKNFLLFFLSLWLGNLYSQPGSVGPDFYNPSIKGSPLVTVIGYKAQSKAPLIDESGRMLLQANGVTVDKFNLIDQKVGRLNWSYDEGYFPSSVHDFTIPNFKVRLKFFCFNRPITSIGQYNGDFVLVYARVILTYTGNQVNGTIPVKIGPPPQLTPINETAIQAGTNDLVYNISSNQTLILDYATATERRTGSGSNTLNSAEIQEIAGDYTSVETQFKNFWKTELDRLVTLVIPSSVPNAVHLSNSQKVSFIHMQVIRVGNDLHVGKNGYDQVFDHDAHGILSSAIEMGGLAEDDAEALLRNLPAQRKGWDYIDALGKVVWAHAKFVQKFSPSKTKIQDLVFSQLHLGGDGSSRPVSEWIHYMVDHKLEADALAVKASTLDTENRSTVDNYAVLIGLKSYAYLCEKVGNTTEKLWAEEQYNKTQKALEQKLLALVSTKEESQKYISAGIENLTENMSHFTFGNTRSAFTNANAYSHFFFGRMFEIFLLGGTFDKIAPYIDNTLDIGLSQVSNDSRFIVDNKWTGNFGIYDNTHYSNGYNTAYAEGFLLGKGKYRDAFFPAFNFMMNCQTGPYNWFEGVRSPHDYGIDIQGQTQAAQVGTGSSPHVWSSMSQARMMTTTFISEKYDGTLLLGRGLPVDWFEKGEVGAANYKLSNGTRFGYTVKPTGNDQEYEVSFKGSTAGKIVLNYLMFIKKEPKIVPYIGAPPDYLTKVKLADVDSDGKNEIVVDHNFSGNKVVFTLSDKVGIKNNNSSSNSNAFRIYLNSVSERLDINSDSEKIKSVILINLSGRVVESKKSSQGNISMDIHHVPNGVYMVKIETNSGSLTRYIVKN